MKEHGSYSLSITHKTIILKASGAWNYEMSVKFCKEFKQTVLPICDSKWASLIDVREWDLATPEVWPPIDALNIWANEHNQVYEIVLYKNSLQKKLLMDSQTLLENVETKFFQDDEHAYNFLRDVNMLEKL